MPDRADVRVRALTHRAAATTALAAAALLSRVPAPLDASAQKPTFSTKTEAVYITATVIDADGRLVTGLTKEDFEIREKGDPRPITVFRSDTVPFAIVVMLDVSGSMFSNLGLMRRGVDLLISRFEPGDRASIGTFQGLPMINPRFTANPQRLMESVSGGMGGMGTPCMGQWAPERFIGGGAGSAVWAAIQCGIEQVAADAETPRRVVMIVTDAMDNASGFVGPSDLKKLADQYGIMIYAVGMSGKEGLNSVTLRDLAETSGGGYFQLNDFAEVVPTFGRVADELRRQYIFGFSPTSSETASRDLEVRSIRPGTTVRWRRVHLQAAPVFTRNATGSPAAPATAAPGSGPPSAPAPIRADSLKGREAIVDALDRFERAEWRDVLAESGTNRRTLDDLIRTIPDWTVALGPKHEARRRLAAATYLLEILEQHARDAAPWQEGRAAFVALEWACTLLHQGPVQMQELWWYDLSVGLLERATAGAPLLKHLEHLRARFPGQARWLLAEAVAEELSAWQYLHDDRELRVRAEALARIDAAYARASLEETTRAESHVRWGFVELRLGHPEKALEHFERAGDTADTHVRYYLHLFKGQALHQAGRIPEAVASFERALGVVPYAQSAALALGAALVEDRRSSEAAALTIRTLALTPPVYDPWTSYLAPEMRFAPQLILELRRAVVTR